MSSRRWPNGKLSAAITKAYRANPLATASQLAGTVGCSPASARVVLRRLGISFVRDNGGLPLSWTPEMKQALLSAALSRKSVDRTAEDMGVHPCTLVLGAFEIIRELAA